MKGLLAKLPKHLINALEILFRGVYCKLENNHLIPPTLIFAKWKNYYNK